MKLDDFNSTVNSAKVSKVLEDKFGTRVDLNKLNLKQLQSLKSRVSEAHKKTVKSMPFNSGHRNPEYLEQVALLEAIELKINEVDNAKLKPGHEWVYPRDGFDPTEYVDDKGRLQSNFKPTKQVPISRKEMSPGEVSNTGNLEANGQLDLAKVNDAITRHAKMFQGDTEIHITRNKKNPNVFHAVGYDQFNDATEDSYRYDPQSKKLYHIDTRHQYQGPGFRQNLDLDETAPKGWEGTVKAMKKHKEIDNPWALANYMKKKGMKSHVDEEVKDDEIDNPARHDKALKSFSGAQTSALLRLVGTKNISNAKRAIKLAAEGKPIPGNLVMGFRPIVDIVLDILQGGSSYVRRLQTLDKQAAHAAHLDESRNLFEGETEKAQLIMAVKDMVDRVQGMVEDLNKMKVEDLVALTDKMRDEFGQDQATSFTSGANDILSTGIDALTNARSELDNAVLALTGEAPAAMPGAEMPAAPGAEAPMPGAEMGAELPAEPGAELPAPEGGEEVGRELRESRKRKKVLESSRFLGKLAK